MTIRQPEFEVYLRNKVVLWYHKLKDWRLSKDDVECLPVGRPCYRGPDAEGEVQLYRFILLFRILYRDKLLPPLHSVDEMAAFRSLYSHSSTTCLTYYQSAHDYIDWFKNRPPEAVPHHVLPPSQTMRPLYEFANGVHYRHKRIGILPKLFPAGLDGFIKATIPEEFEYEALRCVYGSMLNDLSQ